MSGTADLTLFFGRFHPLLVHLPIGFLVLLALLELAARVPRFKHLAGCSGFIAGLTVLAATFSALCGWLLSRGGGYDAELLAWHQWTGIAVAVASAGVFILRLRNRMRFYRVALFLTLGLLVVASHFGGSLTHGSDYLTRHAPGFVRALLGLPALSRPPTAGDPADQAVFAAVIQPVFDTYCVSCHGPEKARGELRLDSFTELMKGSEHGPAVVPGNAAESVLVRFMELPLNHDDHMPPEGRPQPARTDAALIRWWVETGASPDKTLRELNPPDMIRRALQAKLGAAASVEQPAAVAQNQPRLLSELLPVAQHLADELDVAITVLSPDEPWLLCNASLARTNFDDAALARLAPLAANLRWLDLAGTSVSDAGLAQVAQMPNLVRLHLERTAITDDGLTTLAGLRELEYLNLYGTVVSDAALATLKPLPKLRQVYLWQTRVTSDAAAAFAEARRDKEQIAAWEAEIQRLQEQIRGQGTTVHLGAPATPAPPPVPINTLCPVSGKLADRTRTSWHEGKLVAFCCEDCLATFAKDPKPHLAKLTQFASTPPGSLGLKPINDKCPVSGEAVDPKHTAVHEGKVVAFCCAKCRADFEADPKPHLSKLPPAAASASPSTSREE